MMMRFHRFVIFSKFYLDILRSQGKQIYSFICCVQLWLIYLFHTSSLIQLINVREIVLQSYIRKILFIMTYKLAAFFWSLSHFIIMWWKYVFSMKFLWKFKRHFKAICVICSTIFRKWPKSVARSLLRIFDPDPANSGSVEIFSAATVFFSRPVLPSSPYPL